MKKINITNKNISSDNLNKKQDIDIPNPQQNLLKSFLNEIRRKNKNLIYKIQIN